MKTVLDKSFVADCRPEAVPVTADDGRIVGTEPNAKGRFHDVDELHEDPPGGFGLRVNERVETRIVEVRLGCKPVAATVGRHPDLLVGTDVLPERNPRLPARGCQAGAPCCG